MFNKKRAIVFGGSAGSVKLVFNILKKIPNDFYLPIIFVLHRPPETNSNMRQLFQDLSALPIIEPTEPTEIEPSKIYLAPSNLHLLVEYDFKLNIENSPLVQYSRPSIDVLFMSAAQVYQENLIAVLVTGSNEDGAAGIKIVHNYGGITIIQNPSDAIIPRMPQAALEKIQPDYLLNADEIFELLLKLNNRYRPKL